MRGWREALEAAASAVAAGASASSASFSASSYLASPQLSAGDVAAALTAAGRGGSSGRWGTKAGLEAVFASIATQLRLTGSKGRGTASASEPAPVLPLGLTACLLTPLSQPALHAALSLRARAQLNLHDSGCLPLEQGLTKGVARETLETILLWKNGIGVEGIREIAKPLAALPRLAQLNLFRNCLGDSGTHSQKSSMVTLYRKYTGALTFHNVCQAPHCSASSCPSAPALSRCTRCG